MIGIASMIESQMDAALSNFVTTTSQSMMNWVVPIAIVCTTLLMMVQALATIRGDNDKPLSKLLKDFLSISLITFFALSMNNYQSYVIGGAQALQSDLVNAIASGTVNTSSPTSTIGQAIDGIFSPDNCLTPPEGGACLPLDTIFLQQAQKRANFYGIPDLVYVFVAVLIDLAEIAIVLCCLLPWLPAKAALAIWLALGPAAIVCLAWPLTRNYFQQWLSSVLGSIFTMVIIAAVVTIIPNMYQQLAKQVMVNTDTTTDMVGRACCLLVAALGLGIVAVNAAQKGAHLAGGGVALDGRGLALPILREIKNSIFGNKDSKPSGAGGESAGANSATEGMGAARGASEKAGYAAGRGAASISNVLKALNRKR
jgi:type IV secretory pathway VirB6-like protein